MTGEGTMKSNPSNQKKLHLLFQHCTGFCFLTRTLSKKDVSSILQFFFPVMRCECTEIVQDFFKLIKKPARRSSASQHFTRNYSHTTFHFKQKSRDLSNFKRQKQKSANRKQKEKENFLQLLICNRILNNSECQQKSKRK